MNFLRPAVFVALASACGTTSSDTTASTDSSTSSADTSAGPSTSNSSSMTNTTDDTTTTDTPTTTTAPDTSATETTDPVTSEPTTDVSNTDPSTSTDPTGESTETTDATTESTTSESSTDPSATESSTGEPLDPDCDLGDGPDFQITNNGFSDYTIDGQNDPNITVVRGCEYTFNLNASGHPFLIKTVQGNGAANAYNTGVTNNGDDVGVIEWDVAGNAPDDLFYNCQFHNAMAGTITVIDG